MAKKAEKQLSPERKELISKLIDEFDIKSAKDIEEMFKDMFSPMLQEMLEGELDDHLGYEKYEHSGESGNNSRNATAARQLQHHSEIWISAFPATVIARSNPRS